MTLFSGIHAVLYAMFDTAEAIDLSAMERQVAHVLAAGCHGVTVLGLATEVGKLTVPERRAVIACVAGAVAGRVPLSVTVAGNSVAEQRDLAMFAQDQGAAWLILQPPMVGRYDAAVYIDFFARVADGLRVPVAVQNAPQYLGRALSPDDIAALRARCPTLAAIKAEDDLAGLAALQAAAPDLALVGGRGALDMPGVLRLGATGFVLAPDIAPRAVAIWRLWEAGDIAGAEALYAKSLPAISFAMQSLEHLITYGKRIFATNAGIAVHDRAPCLPTTPEGLAQAARMAALLG